MGRTQRLALAHGSDSPGVTASSRIRRSYGVPMAVIATFVVVVVAFASRESGRRLTRDGFGPAWPLTIPSAVVMCEFHDEITVTSHGTTYTLNRPTSASAYDSVAPIWADGAVGTGKKDLSPLIEEGLKLCR